MDFAQRQQQPEQATKMRNKKRNSAGELTTVSGGSTALKNMASENRRRSLEPQVSCSTTTRLLCLARGLTLQCARTPASRQIQQQLHSTTHNRCSHKRHPTRREHEVQCTSVDSLVTCCNCTSVAHHDICMHYTLWVKHSVRAHCSVSHMNWYRAMTKHEDRRMMHTKCISMLSGAAHTDMQ